MRTILIIEDDEPLLSTMADRLAMEGFRVLTAVDGAEGILRVHDDAPDLILCDIMMPVMDGYSVLRALRAGADTASIPFVFMSARATPADVRAGMESGASDYLCKPVSKHGLIACIRAQLA